MSESPLVSCIMPTFDRRPFVAGAIRHFLRQDYPSRELVIVDDGTDPVADLVPADPRIRYLRLEGRRRLGAKRNFACEEARGDILVHWDDDDWMASRRLTYQVGELLRRKVDVCGLDRLFFLDPASNRAWLYSYPGRRGSWAAGGTLCYTRAFWNRNPFPGIDVGEDNRFLSRAKGLRLAVLEDHRFYVATVHPRNTSPKRPGRAPWRSIDAAAVRTLQAEDEAVPVPEQEPAAAPKPAADRHVTVSIPFRGCPKMLRRAVLSILGQTHSDLTLVVVNDGGPPPWDELADLEDPRLVRFDLPVNRGRYFADAVVLGAIRGRYFLMQDADDWSEPHRIASLLSRLEAEAAVGAVSTSLRHDEEHRGSRPALETFPRLASPLTRDFCHRANHQGLFLADALNAIGGYYGGFSIGYDTLLVNFLLMSGRIALVKEPLYHRTLHGASLTRAAATGLRSAARRRAAEDLRRMYEEAFAVYDRYRKGRLDRPALCAALRRIAGSRTTSEQRDALDRETGRLREILAGSEPGRTREAVAVVDSPELAWSGWSITRCLARELAGHLETGRPRRILEIGSGESTVLLADYAARHGASLVALEHEPGYHERTASLLQHFGLRDRVDLKLAPLQPLRCGDGKLHPWYAAELEGPFDFVLADGPPERFGRQAILFAVAPHLAEEWRLWLHNAQRPHEQGCVALWRRHFSFAEALSTADARGALLLEGRKGFLREASPGRTLGITLLTGGRLHLLRRTIDSLLRRCPGLLENHPVVALLNGEDPETEAYLCELPFVGEPLRNTSGILPIGSAASLLMQAVCGRGDVETVLHLEDDWAVEGRETGWLERAQRILEEHPEVGQVRLRHSGEKVLSRHMVTGRPIAWERREGFLLARSAHFTFNPSLIRAQDVPAVYPCRTEQEAQRRFHQAGWATAQLVPGLFRHIGGQDSRRARLAAAHGPREGERAREAG